MHIEQGRVLEELGKKVGIVTAIARATRYSAEIIGAADHSGATPMNIRKDALACAAEIVLEVEKAAKEIGGITAMQSVAEKHKLSSHTMHSGAGHDAMIFAEESIPTGMIFVPCKDGKSHTPEEYAEIDDIIPGVELLYQTVLELDSKL